MTGMRVGLVIYGSLDTVSGGYLYDGQLVNALSDAGDQVDVISLPTRAYVKSMADNWSADWRRRMNRGYDVLLQDELNHPSLAWANGWLGSDRPPIVAIVHHLRSSESRPAWQNQLYYRVERRYLNSADAFIYNSHTTQQAVERALNNGRPSIVAYPGKDRLSGFGPTDYQPLRLTNSPLRLLYVGNLIPRKGLHVLLRALSQVSSDCRLRIVGSPAVDPAYAHKLHEAVLRLELADRVIWCGALDDRELAAEMAAADVLAMPSEYEGFGIVYLEGMGFGLPALATTAGAASEIISDGVNGFLVPPGDAAALAGCIEALAAERGLLARLSEAALARYAAFPTWAASTGAIRAFMLDVAQRERT
ncbi:MAG: glycosyltransferase family 4 protein [Anaerolineae bacterium]|nr:glycosyltransferase family 4 protein [Anaerolineae bacterium]